MKDETRMTKYESSKMKMNFYFNLNLLRVGPLSLWCYVYFAQSSQFVGGAEQGQCDKLTPLVAAVAVEGASSRNVFTERRVVAIGNHN